MLFTLVLADDTGRINIIEDVLEIGDDEVSLDLGQTTDVSLAEITTLSILADVVSGENVDLELGPLQAQTAEVAPIPTPAAWSLVLTGAALFGLLGRRRRTPVVRVGAP